MLGKLRATWHYRGFILGTVKREFQSRYQRSLLGAAWTVLNPLAMILIYTLVFSQVMKARLPGATSSFAYSIFLCAGILTWGLFTEIVMRNQSIFIDNANLLKKLNFPRITLPIVTVISACINFSIIYGLYIIFLLLSGNFPGITFLGIFPLLLIQILFALGLGLTLGVLNVFFRDVGQMMGVLIQFWFWFTPIVYPITAIPERFRMLLQLNPMVGLMTSYQGIMVNHQWPQWHHLLPITIAAVIFCLIAWRLFRKNVGEMMDEL